MQGLQRQITKPSCEDATDEEVLKLFELLWQWTPTPRYMLPSKTLIENLIGLMRGCNSHNYCYISRGDVARIIRKKSKQHDFGGLSIYLSKGADKMTDNELYDDGKWNYKPTPLVDLFRKIHYNPEAFERKQI